MRVDDLVLDMRLRAYRRAFDSLESFIGGSGFEAKQHFRYAFFLRYYAIFENQLKVHCDRFAEDLSLPLRLGDISGEKSAVTRFKEPKDVHEQAAILALLQVEVHDGRCPTRVAQTIATRKGCSAVLNASSSDGVRPSASTNPRFIRSRCGTMSKPHF